MSRILPSVLAAAAVLVAILLAGCDAQGPAATREVAVQGMLSGAVSADGRFGVVGSIHHGGSGWDLAAGERKFDWNHRAGERSTLRAVALSGDGRRAVTVEDRDLAVWDTSTGQSVHYWQASAKILALAVDREGRLAVLGMQNNQAVVFDIQRGAERQVLPHKAEVYGVAISDDGRRVMTGSDDFTAVVWNGETGEPLQRFEHVNQVKIVALSSDGALAFSAAQRQPAQIRDAGTGEVRTVIPLERENFTAVRFSPDAAQVLLGTFRGDVYLFDTRNAARFAHWQARSRQPWGPGSSGAVLSLAWRGSDIVGLTSDGLLQTFAPR